MSTNEASRDNPFTRSFWFGAFDLRPIGLVRITLGLAILLSVVELHQYLGDWFSDRGALPRWLLFDNGVRGARFCLLDAVGERWMLEIYWLATVAAALTFTIGWRTRPSQLVLFVLLSGLYERNLAGLDSSDSVQRIMLFWLLFVPMGARYSVDALRRTVADLPTLTHAPAFAVRVAQLQICWEYLDAFINKARGEMWLNGTALHYALGLDHAFTRGLGRLMFHYDWLTWGGCYFTLVFEAAFAFLVLSPFWQPRARALALIGGVMLHGGIFATMCLGNFSIVMVATYPLFFAPSWIERAQAWLSRFGDATPTLVIADLSCGFCRRAQAVLVACDLRNRVRFIDASEIGDRTFADAGRRRDELYAVSADGQLSRGWFALRAVAERSPLLWLPAWLSRLPLLRAVGPALYDRRARHDRAPAPMIAPLEPLRWPLARGLGRTILAGLLAASIWYSMPPRLADRQPRWIHDTIEFCELWQNWEMFAPTPAHVDIWFKSEGFLTDGHRVDALRDLGGPFPAPDTGYSFDRWRKYTFTLLDEKKPIWAEFGRFVCRRWNLDRPRSRAPLKQYKIFVVERPVPAPHEKAGPWSERLIWQQVCY